MNSSNAGSMRAAGKSARDAASVRQRRQRIGFRDATTLRERVEAGAEPLRLRGARSHVLAAVLSLLCGWSRIDDDRVGLAQIVELVALADGRRYDLKTIGRALATLAGDDLLVYRPARGRGRRAFIAIHDRFLTDIRVLERDHAGRVITDYRTDSDVESVTFSRPCPSIDQTPYPPTPRPEMPSDGSRPIAVTVSTEDLRAVLQHVPQPLAELPKHLRWLLGREIRQRLERGWGTDQILDVLAAPMPADVARPWRLALWRLRHNLVGSGPRLRPLQRAWEAHVDGDGREAAANTTARWYRNVAAVTTPQLRADLLAAHTVKFGQPITEPVTALAGAGRRVRRLFPEMDLAPALARWARDILGGQRSGVVQSQPFTAGADLVTDLVIHGGGSCVACGDERGIYREELPLPAIATVCDQCWADIAVDLAPPQATISRTGYPHD